MVKLEKPGEGFKTPKIHENINFKILKTATWEKLENREKVKNKKRESCENE